MLVYERNKKEALECVDSAHSRAEGKTINWDDVLAYTPKTIIEEVK